MNCSPDGKNTLAVFPEWAEQSVVVYSNPRAFSYVWRSASPTNVRVFCDTTADGVAQDYFPQLKHEIGISPEFGAEVLQVFNEKYTIQNGVMVDVHSWSV